MRRLVCYMFFLLCYVFVELKRELSFICKRTIVGVAF